MFWDQHTHTTFSSDAKSSPEEMVQSAISKGLAGICFTDHMDYDYPAGYDGFVFDPAEYWPALTALRDKYEGRFPIHIGIELGLQNHLGDYFHKLVNEQPYDFVIGSSHVTPTGDPYYPDFYEGRTEEEAYRDYFQSVIDYTKNCPDFDVYGHIDYVVRYGPNKNKEYTYKKYQDLIDTGLKLLVENGKGIEVNSSGIRYGLGHTHPIMDIIKRYREMGGEILTIGSDAHKAIDVGADFSETVEIIKSCGFMYYTVFEQRKPRMIKL